MASFIKPLVIVLWSSALLSARARQPLLLPPTTPAFPGAVGFVVAATGGTVLDAQGHHTGGIAYHVTNLNDSGPGSFRDAVSQGGRIVVFDVGGWVRLADKVHVVGNVTIAGQTAPGDGIGFLGHGIGLDNSSNIIVRHIRVRVGDGGPKYGIHLNGIGMHLAQNIILDHVSVAFAPWNNIDSVKATNITVQDLLLTDPIFQKFNDHFEKGPATFFANLWCNAHGRQPLSRRSAQYANNVVYNFGYAFAAHGAPAGSNWDILHNYFISGPETHSPGDTYFQIPPTCNAYAAGNLPASRKDGMLDGVSYNTVGPARPLAAPAFPSTATLPVLPAASAFIQTVSQAGAFPRDSVDLQTLDQVRSLGKTGAFLTSQTQTGLPNGGYGNLNGGAASVDSDGDGLPDDWELAKGLDPANPRDAGQTAASGYTNLEDYLNWKAQPNADIGKSSPGHATSADFDLAKLAAGFIGTPTFAVSDVFGGTVTLSGPDGSVAHFVPTQNTSGLGGFTYTIGNGSFTLRGKAGILISAKSAAD